MAFPEVRKKKSFKYTLSKIGAIAEPCQTPKNYVFEITANAVDTNTVFMNFQN